MVSESCSGDVSELQSYMDRKWETKRGGIQDGTHGNEKGAGTKMLVPMATLLNTVVKD